ncbi:MAG: response regulator transcription factor [Syntrophobacter sp.]
MKRILVIDDDTELCELLREYLESEGFEVAVAHDGKEGHDRAFSSDYTLVVLDVMLPTMSGFEVLRGIRSQSAVPIVMLTARSEDVDRIVGLEMGADDYLPKPFNPRELMARIRAVLRRTEGESREPLPAQAPERLVLGDIQMDLGTRVVNRGQEVVELTYVEFNLLERLLRAAGRVVTREELARGALDRMLGIYDRSIDVHISSLRRKLGQYCDGIERIKTVRGAGYLYALMPSRGGEAPDESGEH